MSLADRLEQPDSHPAAQRRDHRHPTGWEPGINTADGIVTAISDDVTGPDWSHVLEQLGLDPADWTVVGDAAEIRSWDVVTRDGVVRAWYHRARVRPSRGVGAIDVEELCAEVARRRPLKNATADPVDGGWLAVVPADWQAGKNTGGGPEQLVDRVVRLKAAVPARARQLRRGGVDCPNLLVVLPGDNVESCDGHYPMQQFEVALDMREQTKLVRRLIVELLDAWAPHFSRIVVIVAAGNHGEKRKNGKVVTSWSDNLDVEIPEQVAEILAANPDRFGHVQFRLPSPDELTVTVEVDGTHVGVAHGHQCSRGGGTVQARVLSWLDKQAGNRAPIGDCDVLVTGHHHHFESYRWGTADGPRVWFQAPALDGGSPWFQHTGGRWTDAGTLTFVVADGGAGFEWIIPADGTDGG